MAIASKSSVSIRKTQVSSKAGTVAELNSRVTPVLRKTYHSPNPPLLLRSRSTPLWLLRLCCLQRRFSAIAFLLVTGMVAVYSCSAYFEKMWNQARRQLEILQVHERQLTTTNEALKNQMGRQAQQPNTGLVPPNPAETIVLQPAPPRPPNAAESASSTANSAAQTAKTTEIPLGY